MEDQSEVFMIKCELEHHATKRVVLMQKSLACDENRMVTSHTVSGVTWLMGLICNNLYYYKLMGVYITIEVRVFQISELGCSFFSQVTMLEENPQVLPLILRMVPKVNPRLFKA
jgi:hypothetical protein